MLLPAVIHRIQLIVHKRYYDDVLRFLRENKTVQLLDVKEIIKGYDAAVTSTSSSERVYRLATLSSKTNQLVSVLQVDQGLKQRIEVRPEISDSELEQFEREVAEIDGQATKINAQLQSIEQLSKYAEEGLEASVREIVKIHDVGTPEGRHELEEVMERIFPAIKPTELDEVGELAALLKTKAVEDAIKKALTDEIADLLKRKDKPETAIRNELSKVLGLKLRSEMRHRRVTAELETQIQETKKLRSELKDELAKIAREKGPRLLVLSELVNAERVLEEAKSYTGRTSSTYVIEGYVPQDQLAAVERGILQITYNRCVFRSWVSQSAPTRLQNPRIASLFEKLTVGFATPKSDEVDPSILWLITYPLFFGLMFGDIAHGALVVIISAIMYVAAKRGFRFKIALLNMVLDGAPLLIMGGFAAMVVGFLYGSVFGSEEWFEQLTGIHGPPWFSPWQDPIQLLKVSMYVAVFHVSSGLMLSIINKVRHHDYWGALAGPGIWLVFYVDFGYLVLSKGFGFVTFVFQNTATAMLYLAPPVVVMLLLYVKRYGKGDGVIHWIEALFASLSHTISYARILAMKMIHDGFSILFLGILNTSSIVLAVGTGAVFALLTIVVILGLETLFVFMQALRLHWVEWFLKFYAGGGVSFKPFGIDRNYTVLSTRTP